MSDEETSQLIKSMQELREEVKELKGQIRIGLKPSYTNQEVLKILGVSAPTLRQWRYDGLIGYSQIGSTFEYSQRDIQEFLEHHHNNAYAYSA